MSLSWKQLAVAAWWTLALSCSGMSTGSVLDVKEGDVPITAGDTGQTLMGLKPGEPCTSAAQCRLGLECKDGVCASTGSGTEDSFCVLSSDCGEGLVCAIDLSEPADDKQPAGLAKPKMCMPEGDGDQWDSCTTEADCKKGMYCKIISFTGTCQPAGSAEVGDKCDDTGDCAAGLACAADGVCGIMGAQIPLFLGEECESSKQIGGPARVLFEVPRKGQALKDFYRLPFPNDIRIRDGLVDLTGHPTPGPGVAGFDVAARVMEAIGEDLHAFGTNPVVYFRFSQAPKLSTINPKGGTEDVFLVDITNPSDLGWGKKHSISWVASTGRGKFICQNFLAMHVPGARPLDGNRIYAAILTDAIKADPGEEGGDPVTLVKADDFKVMLSETAPTDPDVKDAWARYAPLRKYLASQAAADLGISAANTVGAAVFTTYDPIARMAKFKEKMDGIALPKISGAVLCDGNAVSPCDDGLTGPEHVRGCLGTHPDFYEIQGLVELPVFQKGKPPYLEPDDGAGSVEFDPLGLPNLQRFEKVCFSLAIPKGTPPQSGWPVVLYGHGTGGSYRSQVNEEVVDKLVKLKVWDETTQACDRPQPIAVLGWDQVLHGPRVGDNPIDPESVVFNFRNPRGSLGNFYQAAAETMALARLLAAWNAPVDGVTYALDPDNVFFLGHSQGGISGPLAIPFADTVDNMVISGTGGGLVESLLRKSSPVDVKDGVIVALQDDDVSRTHPILSLVQQYYEPVDPINYARFLFHNPMNGHKVHTLQTLGIDDLHTPPKTMKDLSAAMYGELARSPSMPEADFESFSGVNVVDLPRKVNGGLTVEYSPKAGEDGHFVIFSNDDAIRHYTNFFGTEVLDGTPVVIK